MGQYLSIPSGGLFSFFSVFLLFSFLMVMLGLDLETAMVRQNLSKETLLC